MTGWAVGGGVDSDNARDAAFFYDKLEQKVLPRYYGDRSDWIAIMKGAISHNASFFNSHPMDGKQRRELIAVAAYFRAERRGFAPSAEWDDWFQAEIEIDTQLQEAAGRLPRSHATASHT